MNRQFFNQQFAALVSAYTISGQLSDESQDVYWEMLKDIAENKFAEGVMKCLATCKYFPTIAELGSASMPNIPDRMAPLPPINKPRPTIDWRTQIAREKQRQLGQRNPRPTQEEIEDLNHK